MGGKIPIVKGGISAWNICPLFKGIGYGTTVVVYLLNVYYIVVLAWALLYLVYSVMYFGAVLPWSRCDQAWNTPACTVGSGAANGTSNSDAANEFWERRVLRLSSGIDDVGDGINWPLAACLLAVWVMCYLCVFKGVKWTGKVVWFTALYPYCLLTVLIVRGVTLPGAMSGLAFLLTPDFSRLTEAQVWIDAGTQILFSYGTSLGALTALGSYNDYYTDCYRNSLIVCAVNSVTSLLSGVAVFSVLGFLSLETGVPIEEVSDKGPGLAFIAYPRAIAHLGVSGLFSVVFFVMLIVLGLDSQFVSFESLVTAISDLYPATLRHRRKSLCALLSLMSFLFGLTMVTDGGMYVFQLLDYYAASGFALLWLCIWECIAIGWAYGAERYCDRVEDMIGYRPSRWMSFAWRWSGVAFCAFVFAFSLSKFERLTYNNRYEYPWWAECIGLLLAASSAICVPVYAVYALYCVSAQYPDETWRWRMRRAMHGEVTERRNTSSFSAGQHTETSMALLPIASTLQWRA